MGRKPIRGQCRYCGLPSMIQWSHAIPRAYFKPMMQDGNVLAIGSDGLQVTTTNNSGADHLLCRTCEAGFNYEFEDAVDKDLKAAGRRILSSFLPLEDRIDNTSLIRFIAACLWRCSISKNTMWDDLQADQNLRDLWKEMIFGDLEEVCRYASFGIRKSLDNKPGAMNSALSGVLLPPRHIYRERTDDDKFSTSFSILGFILEFHLPFVPAPDWERYGILIPGRDRIKIPQVYFLEHHLTHAAAMEAIRKDTSGAYSSSAKAFLSKSR